MTLSALKLVLSALAMTTLRRLGALTSKPQVTRTASLAASFCLSLAMTATAAVMGLVVSLTTRAAASTAAASLKSR